MDILGANRLSDPKTTIQQALPTSVLNFTKGTITSGAAYRIAADPEFVWVCDYTDPGRLVKFNADTLAVINVLNLGVGVIPQDVAVDSDFVWVALSTNDLIKVSRATNTILAIIPTGFSNINNIVVYDAFVYVLSFNSARIIKINRTTGAVIGNLTTSAQPSGATLDNQGRIWIVNGNSNNFQVIDTASFTIVNTTALGFPANKIAFDGEAIWIARSAAAYILRKVDVYSYATLKDVSFAGGLVEGLAHLGRHLGITSNNQIYMLDYASNTINSYLSLTGVLGIAAGRQKFYTTAGVNVYPFLIR